MDYHYRIGDNRPGAFTLDLQMTVNQPSKDEKGIAKITQAVSPPLDLQTNVHGSYDKLENNIVAYMTGQPMAPGAIQFQGALVVPEWGKPGEASYFFVDSKGKTTHVGPVQALPIKKTEQ